MHESISAVAWERALRLEKGRLGGKREGVEWLDALAQWHEPPEMEEDGGGGGRLMACEK